MNNDAINLGDTVSGYYFDVPFTGVVVSCDCSGVRIEGVDIIVNNIKRSAVWLSDTDTIRLVKRGNATESDVATAPYHLGGASYLRSDARVRAGLTARPIEPARSIPHAPPRDDVAQSEPTSLPSFCDR